MKLRARMGVGEPCSREALLQGSGSDPPIVRLALPTPTQTFGRLRPPGHLPAVFPSSSWAHWRLSALGRVFLTVSDGMCGPCTSPHSEAYGRSHPAGVTSGAACRWPGSHLTGDAPSSAFDAALEGHGSGVLPGPPAGVSSSVLIETRCLKVKAQLGRGGLI